MEQINRQVVVGVAQWSLPTPKDPGLNLVSRIFIKHVFIVIF